MSAIFLVSAWGKIVAPKETLTAIEAVGLPLPKVAFAAAVFVELLAGLMLTLGYRTKLAALALALFTMVSSVAFHGEVSDPTHMTHLLKNLAITGGMLLVLVSGAGCFSLDAQRRAS